MKPPVPQVDAYLEDRPYGTFLKRLDPGVPEQRVGPPRRCQPKLLLTLSKPPAKPIRL